MSMISDDENTDLTDVSNISCSSDMMDSTDISNTDSNDLFLNTCNTYIPNPLINHFKTMTKFDQYNYLLNKKNKTILETIMLSRHPLIKSYDIVYRRDQFNMDYLSANMYLPISFISHHLNYNWNWLIISYRTDLTLDFVITCFNCLDLSIVCKYNNITINDIIRATEGAFYLNYDSLFKDIVSKDNFIKEQLSFNEIVNSPLKEWGYIDGPESLNYDQFIDGINKKLFNYGDTSNDDEIFEYY